MVNKYARLCIGVTGLNANDNPGPGVAVIRCLHEAFGDGLRIIGLCYDTLEPGIYMRNLINKTYQIPYPTAGSEALLDRVKYIHEQEKLDIIIPNFDSELFNFNKLVQAFKQMGISTFLPSNPQLALREKINLTTFGERHGFNIPADQKLYLPSDTSKAESDFGYPMVIKGKFYEASIVYNSEQATKAFYDLSNKWGLPVLAQQFIRGTEINIAGLGDGGGGNVSIIPMRKLYITDKGKAWAGVTIQDDALITLANQFTTATNWRGGYELEVMRDAGDQLYILEINPRFPAWIYLSAAAGQNQPAELVKMALGDAVETFTTYQTGKLFVRYSWDQVMEINDFQQLSAFGEL